LCDKSPQNYEQGPCSQGDCGNLSNKADYACLEVVDESFGSFSPLCRKIRKKRFPLINYNQNRPESNINDCWCCNQDNLIAGYLLGKEGSKEKVESEEINPIKVESEAGNYWRCTCRVTGFTKLAFKIDLDIKNLPLVMICGQFLVDDGEKDSKRNIAKNNKLSVEHEVDKTKSIPIDEMQKIASTIFDEIETLKVRILTIHKTRLRSINNMFIGNIIPEIAKSEWKYGELKDEIHRLVKEYADLADISKITCFMTTYLDEQLGTDITNEHGASIEVKFIDEYQSRNLELVKISDIDTKWLCKIPNLNDYTHLIFPSDSHQFNIVVLLHIDNKNVNDKKIMKAYREFFKIMLPVVRGVASGLFHKHKNKVIDRFAKDLRHELGQSNIGFLANLDHFENNIFTCRDLDEYYKKMENIIKNSKAYAYTTMLRTNTSRYMQGVPIPRKSYFLPYSAFLYKWGEIYYDKMNDSGLKFILTKLAKDAQGNVRSNLRPHMFADQHMIEQVAYNLTNNAIKYSLPRTTVSVDCRLNDSRDAYQLIVTNYGVSLKEEEYKQIFEYGFQGSNADIPLENVDYKDSVGIGLYLSKEIAERHDGKLELFYEKISNLCVPYFDLYLNSVNNPFWEAALNLYKLQVQDLRSKIQAETEHLKRDHPDYWREMNVEITQDFGVDLYNIAETINKSVTRYTFILSIPHQERK
jgi:hypothetical protein